MADRGRKPIPLTLQDLFGSTPAVQQGGLSVMPAPTEGELTPPARLNLDQDALDYFDFYVKSVGKGHFAPLDTPMLADLCLFRSLFDRITREYMAAPTLNQLLANGTAIGHPSMPAMVKISEQIRRLSIELALTITERARMRPSGDAAVDKANEEVQKLRAKYLHGPESRNS